MRVAPRANWKGFLKVGEVACAVALYTAASSSERIAFQTVNRATGHAVRRQFVDSETGKPVEKEDQVKGYDRGEEDYVVLEPEEIAAAVPESDKTLAVEAFVACDELDELYLDKPYYLAPADAAAEEAFVLIREGLRAKKVAALAQTVLFRRVRTLLIRPLGQGLIADTLNFAYEVRSAAEAFDGLPAGKVKGEMLDLARHIIATKKGEFDPAAFEDRYDEALAELVQAKLAGRRIEPRAAPTSAKVVNLLEALRESAGRKQASRKGAAKPKPRNAAAKAKRAAKASPQRRKAS